jgi:predicted dehydrogenase
MRARRRVGLIGAGVMGQRHARVIGMHPQCDLTVVVDHSDHRAIAAARSDRTDISTDVAALAGCDAVVVAVGSDQHHSVTMPLIAAGVAVLVEKPLALHADDVQAMLAGARASGVPLAAGFSQRHHPAWLAFEQATAGCDRRGEWSSTRRSPAVARATGSTVLDLMIHDLDLLDGWDGGSDTGGWRSAGDGLRVTASGRRAEVVATLIADRDATTKERSVVARLDGVQVTADLLASTIAVRYADGTDEHRACAGTEPLVRQWEWFLDLADGRHDPAIELERLARVHHLAFTVDDARAVIA